MKLFIKSLVSPLHMVKYRYMSIFVAIIIFLIGNYLLMFPQRPAIAENVLRFKDDYVLLTLSEIPDDEVINQTIKDLVDLECRFDNKLKKLVCNELAEDQTFESLITYQKNGITKNIHFIIDYYKSVPNYNLTEGFLLEDYPYVDNTEDYFIVLTTMAFYYQAYPKGIDEEEVTHNGNDIKAMQMYFSYPDLNNEFSLQVDQPLANGYELGSYLVDKILIGLAAREQSITQLFMFIVTIIFPLLIVLIFWMFFKRNSRLKSFKEYYNIAAITSIVPFIVAFTVSWFYPNILNWFMILFSFYYLYSLYKINNSPELI